MVYSSNLGAESFVSAYFGEGCGLIALDNLNCSGTESYPQQCRTQVNTNYRSCGHHQDAGVRCALTGERA